MNIDIKIPNVGESIIEVVFTKWFKKNGDYVKIDESIAEIESEKATFEITAKCSGILHIYVEADNNNISVGKIIGSIEKIEKEDKYETKDIIKNNTSNIIAPSAKKLLSQNKISDVEIVGTGKNKRITKKDVIEYLEVNKIQNNTDINKNNNTDINKDNNTDINKDNNTDINKDNNTDINKDNNTDINKDNNTDINKDNKIVPMSNLRKTISKKLVQVINTAAILTTFNEVDMSNIILARNTYKNLFKKQNDVNLGFMSFFVKACTNALNKMPIINAKILNEDSILYNSDINISIAVSTDKGLVVPVLKNTLNMGFKEIEKSISNLADKARKGNISIDDIKDGTFTITNGGTFGSMLSTPIINGDQSAILGMHNIVKRPVVVNNEILIRPIMYLALSYDHRIIDGKEAITFLLTIKNMLEDPIRLLINI